MMAFIGGAGVVVRRRDPVVCAKKGKGGDKKPKAGKKGFGKSEVKGGEGVEAAPVGAQKGAENGKEEVAVPVPVMAGDGKLMPIVSTEGLRQPVVLGDLLGAANTRPKAQSGGTLFDDDEWIEWDRSVCGEWDAPKGFFEFVNALVPELLHLSFPSFAEALKLVVVIVVLFFILAAFTYTVDGVYLSLAKKFFGNEYFF